jgi:hypothetical protein
MHEYGIIHRDIKGENFIFMEDPAFAVRMRRSPRRSPARTSGDMSIDDPVAAPPVRRIPATAVTDQARAAAGGQADRPGHEPDVRPQEASCRCATCLTDSLRAWLCVAIAHAGTFLLRLLDGVFAGGSVLASIGSVWHPMQHPGSVWHQIGGPTPQVRWGPRDLCRRRWCTMRRTSRPWTSSAWAWCCSSCWSAASPSPSRCAACGPGGARCSSSAHGGKAASLDSCPHACSAAQTDYLR